MNSIELPPKCIRFALVLFLAMFILPLTVAQTVITGSVSDRKHEAVPFASIFIEGTYEGTVSDDSGRFMLQTKRTGTIRLGASCVGMEPEIKEIGIAGKALQVDFHLKESPAAITPVVITAGTFSAGERGKAELLKPRDIGTTAGSPGDIQSTIEALPGTQRVGYTEGLFVRGGSGRESQYIMDGLIYPDPYYSHVPSMKQRARLDPFLFSGTIFSAGGYSAQYGQALSSVLILNSKGLADSTVTGGGIHSFGGSVFHTHRWKNISLYASGYYNNFQAWNSLTPQTIHWTRSPLNKEIKMVLRARPAKNSLLKVYADLSDTRIGIRIDPFSDSTSIPFRQENINYVIHATYTTCSSDDQNSLYLGASLSHNNDRARLSGHPLEQSDDLTEAKVVFKHHFTPQIRILIGGDYLYNALWGRNDTLHAAVYPGTIAAFTETEATVDNRLALRMGIRSEYSTPGDQLILVPRTSFSYKVTPISQLSFSYGIFSQVPDKLDLLYNQGRLSNERATHMIVDYQIQKNDRTLRIEFYHKQYNKLVTTFLPQVNYAGHAGYARGLEIFFRDRTTIPNLDWWLSYSFTDSRRRTLIPNEWVTPDYVSKHSLSLVGKYWFSHPGILLSGSFYYASSRKYTYLDASGLSRILGIPDYASLDLSFSRPMMLFHKTALLFGSVQNVTGTDKLLGYVSITGRDTPFPVYRSERRSFFIGLFISMYND